MWTSWETRCGIASYSGALVPALERLGVTVDIVPVPYTDRSSETLAKTVERLNAADLIHLQHEYTFFGGIAPGSSSLPRYLSALRKPWVVTAHTVFDAAELLRIEQEHRWRQRLAKKALAAMPRYRHSVEVAPFAGAKAVIVHTEAARERLVERGFRREGVHVFPAGIPAPLPVDDAQVAALRERLALPPGKVLTIFGYVSPDKGYHTALDALSKLPGTVNLLIAGGTRVEHEAGYLDQLREEIRKRGLTSRVAISGYLEEAEIAAAMALTDVVLVPHTAANGSYSVMIALAYGKPVLASDLDCFYELQQLHGCVELFGVEDETGLAEQAGYLLATASARRTLCENAAKFTASQSWDAVAARTKAVYEQVLAR